MSQSITVKKTATIEKPAEELYRFWRNLENLPRFTRHLKRLKVTIMGDRTGLPAHQWGAALSGIPGLQTINLMK